MQTKKQEQAKFLGAMNNLMSLKRARLSTAAISGMLLVGAGILFVSGERLSAGALVVTGASLLVSSIVLSD